MNEKQNLLSAILKTQSTATWGRDFYGLDKKFKWECDLFPA